MEFLINLFLPVSIYLQIIFQGSIEFFKGITFLGDTEFYIIAMPALFWCINTALGIRIGIMLLLSGSINTLLKFSFGWPRPFWVTDQVTPYVEASGFGFPSGHAQNAAGIWGMVAAKTKSWIRWISLALIFLIGFSRIVLGVHFTHDVLAGWLVGGLLLWLFLRFEQPVVDWFKNLKLGVKLAVFTGISLGLILIAAILVNPFNPPPLPSLWGDNVGPDLNPYSYDGLLTTTGSLLGLGVGVVLLFEGRPFSHHGPIWQRVVRYLVGLIGVLILYLGLGSIFPDEISLISYALRFLRYFLIGFWIAFGAPRVFQKIGLAE